MPIIESQVRRDSETFARRRKARLAAVERRAAAKKAS